MWTAFENLESRRMMSASPLLDELGLSNADEVQSQHSLMVTRGHGPITRGTPVIDVRKLAGNFAEKTPNKLFVSRVRITSVQADGVVRGKMTLAAIASNVRLKGRISNDGRFRLRFEQDFNNPVGLKGYYIGKMNADGARLSGNMNFTWNTPPSTTEGFKIQFIRIGK